MTTTSSSIQVEDQLELRIEKEVRQQMDSILERIQKIASEYKIADKDEKSPFRNVLAVAVEPSSSLEIIKNYIRYQVGRSGSSRIWSLKKEKKLFAKELVEALDGLSKDVDEIFGRVKKSLGSDEKGNDSSDDLSQTEIANELSVEQREQLTYLEDNKAALERSLHLQLAQLYLGYLAREHTAQVGESKELNSSEDKHTKPPEAKNKHSSDSLNKPGQPNKRGKSKRR
jgi:hypothetical protein